MKPRLQRIMRVGVAAVLIAGVLAAAVVTSRQLIAYRQRERALMQFEHFSASIQLMGATSTERGLSVLSMSATADSADMRAQLESARTEVDRLLAGVLALTGDEGDHGDILRDDAASFRHILTEGRRHVDDQLRAGPGKRASRDIEDAVRTIYDAASQAQLLRDDLGEILIGLTPDLTPFMTAASAASDLREYAGRIRSLVVIRINAGERPSAEAAAEFSSMLALTDILQRQIEHYAAPFIDDPAIDRAVHAITFAYFADARAHAETVFANTGGGTSAGVEAFNERYTPAIRTTEALRERILDAGRARLDAARDQALRLAALCFIGAVVGSLVAIASLVLFDRGVFRPLVLARERMARILEGDLDAASAGTSASFLEMTELDRDIETLRRQQLDLRRLEREREVMSRELRRLATTDPLTGLMNRRAFEDRVAAIFEDPLALGAGLGIVMIDIDHFKSINDRFGHGIGDAVLRGFGRFLLGELPPGGHVARFGGEEFMMAVADIDRQTLRARVEALRARLEAAAILPEPRLQITASFGIHWAPAGGRLDWDEFHRLADGSLYEAKRAGRNRVAASA